MKRRIVLATIVALVLATIHVFGQEKKTSTDSTIVKAELIKKYESEKTVIQEMISKRMAVLTSADAVYNQLVGMRANYDKLIKELNQQPINKR